MLQLQLHTRPPGGAARTIGNLNRYHIYPPEMVAAKSPIVAYIGRCGVRIPAVAFWQRITGKIYKAFLKSMVVQENVHPGKPRGMGRIKRVGYTHEKIEENGEMLEYLLVPRVAVQKFVSRGILVLRDDPIPERKPLPAPREVCLKFNDEAFPDGLYEYQNVMIEHILNECFDKKHADEHAATVYIKMAAGLGKTLTMAGLISHLGVPTLYVVPTVGLAEQAESDIRLGLPTARCAIYKNVPKRSKKIAPTPATHDIVIIVINTFRDKSPDFMEGYGLVIFDEAHELHSPVNSQGLLLAQTRYVVGMSATPGERKAGDGEGAPHGLDHFVRVHLGPVLHQEDVPGFDAGEANFIGEARRIEYAGHPDFCETGLTDSGTTSAIMTIANFMKDPYRLRLIAEQAYELYNMHNTEEAAAYGLGRDESDPPGAPLRRHGVLVFAEHREALPAIRAELVRVFEEKKIDSAEIETPELANEKNRSVSILRGGTAKGELGAVRAAGAHIVLVTYGYGRRGISLQEMTAMILASPRRNGMNQLNGRIRRRGSDQRIKRIVVDIVDVRTPLKNQSSNRNKSYKKLGYTVTTRKVSHTGVGLPAIDEDESQEEDSIEDLMNDGDLIDSGRKINMEQLDAALQDSYEDVRDGANSAEDTSLNTSDSESDADADVDAVAAPADESESGAQSDADSLEDLYADADDVTPSGDGGEVALSGDGDSLEDLYDNDNGWDSLDDLLD